jgi:hypothetical protein
MADWRAVAVLVDLLASVTYGVQDFIGGVVSRRNHVFTRHPRHCGLSPWQRSLPAGPDRP